MKQRSTTSRTRIAHLVLAALAALAFGLVVLQSDSVVAALPSADGLFPDVSGGYVEEASSSAFAFPDLSGLINLVGSGDKYIVRLQEDIDTDIVDQHVEWLKNQLGSSLPVGHILDRYDFGPGQFHGYLGHFHPFVVELLRRLPVIKSIEKDQTVTLSQVIEPPLTQTGATWNLARIWQRAVTQPSVYSFNPRSGKNVDVYILDTGVMPNHVQLAGRVLAGPNFSSDNTSNDLNGHGSHVAGISGAIINGVARNTSIINVKVLNAAGSGSWSSMISALNWVVSRKNSTGRASVVNMSIAGPKSDALNAAVKSAVDSGVHVVVAAGNSGADSCQYSPASASLVTPGVLVVGAINSQNRLTSWSNWGSCVNVLAPGDGITSLSRASSTGTVMMSGTSMASPHVTGAVAGILAQVGMSPSLMVRYLRNAATKGVVNTISRANTANTLLFLNASRISADVVRAYLV
ncbi:hypothetical protein H9P43_008006 [Blastocladiella emersonii ATCC 22665]|nr:hypothetical protein H9P43_008006 [Blastocladiella emersonii ATCC 22665]